MTAKVSINISERGLGQIVILARDAKERAEAHQFLAKSAPALEDLDQSLKVKKEK
jgi:hypothetical protein